MKNILKSGYSFLILVALILNWSCESGDKDKLPAYSEGAFVVSEGQFGAANGSVTFYDTSANVATQTLFKTANGNFSGDVLQSLTFNGDKVYMVLNGSSKIEIADSKTFASIGTIVSDDIDKPRYMIVIGDKAYLSVWGAYDDNYSLIDSYVAVIDLNSKKVIKKIDTDEGVNNLLYNGNYLFASNYNFGGSNTLAVINPSDNSRVDQIELVAGPYGLVLDVNDKLWVICTGNYGGNDGKLFRINTSTLDIEDSFDLGVNPGGDLSISPDKTKLIYNVGTKIYKMDISDEEVPSEPFIEASDITTPYGLDVNPANGDIYFCDALNYASEGKVNIYSAEGALKSSFSTGISPTAVIFH